MKRVISAIISIALVLGCFSVSVFAEATSSVYTIDATAKTISKVAPLTTVAAFKANITGAEVEVVNVDGSVMSDTAYATENVFAKIDGVLYKISVEYPYDPINTYGRNYRADGDVLFEKASANFNSTTGGQEVRTNSGFAYATSGYKLGDASGAAPSINTGARTLITKQTEDGKPVYVIQNDAPRYAFLRSHYSSAKYASETQSELTNITKNKVSVTTVTFKADKLGNVSVHHNAAGYATSFGGDNSMNSFTYSGNATYIPNAVHFTQDGTIKIGGTYVNGASATDRTPKHTTSATWEANKEYTVSIVQKLNDGGGRYGYVYGVYVNGEKIFPKGNEAKDGNSHFSYSSSKDAYSMTTRGEDYKYLGGISAVLIGAAPASAGVDLKVSFSDVKVYTVDSALLYTGDIDKELVLEDAEGVDVEGTTINVSAEETVESLRAKYPEYAFAVYNSDGSQPAATENLVTGMSAKVVSANGVQVKVYSIAATKKINETEPESTVYTVDTEAKTISKVAPLTTVAEFLANFTNGAELEVVNIDGSVMSDDAYATENVSLKLPNGELYAISVKYAYTPIASSALVDGTVLYDRTANNAHQHEFNNGGFNRVQVYDKLGYGSDSTNKPLNTEDQTVKATKQTVDGESVYVMENDSNQYAYIRSHYSESSNYSTTLNGTIDSWTKNQIVTSFEFEADKLGNISLFNNTPYRDGDKNMKKGDSGVDGFIYSAEIPYAANSVHFLEDGSVKLGGMYANYSTSLRTPIQETDFTWEPGKKYTVSVVQRYHRGAREGYIDGVYVNGTKIFPNSKTKSHTDGRLALQSDGTFKLGTRDSSHRHGGGLSSIMIGTAPKTAGENLTVNVSDVKIYALDSINGFDGAIDAPITITSNDPTIVVDNDKAIIRRMSDVTEADFVTDAKIKIEAGYLKAVSADGLVAKTYAIEFTDVENGFFAGENGSEIGGLTDSTNSVCFTAFVDESSLLGDVKPVVILGLYEGNRLVDTVAATGTVYEGEITKYKAVLDITGYNKDNIELRGFVWGDINGEYSPLSATAVISK